METKTENLCNLARQLKLTGAGGAMNALLINAQQKQISYLDFAFGLLNAEIEHRNQQNLTKRLRNAKLPADHDLGMWQENHLSGISGFYALIDPSYTLQIDPPKLTALI